MFTAVRCPDPPVVENGYQLVDAGSYYYSDMVQYGCELGYELSGSALLTCDQQGHWDRSPPRCDRESWLIRTAVMIVVTLM